MAATECALGYEAVSSGVLSSVAGVGGPLFWWQVVVEASVRVSISSTLGPRTLLKTTINAQLPL